MSKQIFDVIIIGGSYAGLSAAMALGRSRRSVLVIDSGMPCNRQTPHSHNFITQDGEQPAIIARKARTQVGAYPTVTFHSGKALRTEQAGPDFLVTTEGKETFTAKKLLLATGVRDIPMNIKDFAACWGISVLHCPYCHGYEVRDETLGVIANGDMGFEYAQLISNWSADLTLFTNGRSTLRPEQRAKLEQHHIRTVEQEIDAISHKNGYMRHLVFKDGTTYPLAAVFARGGIEQQDIVKSMECELHTEGFYTGLIKVDEFGKTPQPGIYAAGDNTTPMRSVAAAVAAGNKAGAMLNKELIAERF